MKHLSRVPSQFSISIPEDENGLIGRECPESTCESYFKIQLGTGLKGEDLPCHCPYCGHSAGQDEFFTEAQIEYAKSVVLNEVSGALIKDLKSMEFDHKPKGDFGIGISMKVSGKATPIRYYCEEDLETEVVCNKCTLRYMIFGVFGFCPDCGIHNSLQILEKNFEVIKKMITMAKTQDPSVSQQLIENALEDCVSSFDGFGRETCRVFATEANDPKKVAEIRFQNIKGAIKEVLKQYDIDLSTSLESADWVHVQEAFQKRHLLAHKMGVVDAEYQKATGTSPSLIGRRVSIQVEEINFLLRALHKLGKQLYQNLESKTCATSHK